MVDNINSREKVGYSNPITIIYDEGTPRLLNLETNVLLSVSIPDRWCDIKEVNTACMHVLPILYRSGFPPQTIHGDLLNLKKPQEICIRQDSLPKKLTLNPDICFYSLSPCKKEDPICSIMAHILANDAHIEFEIDNKRNYTTATLTLLSKYPSKKVVYKTNNYRVPIMFRSVN